MDTGQKPPGIVQVEAVAACVGVILLILAVTTIIVVIIIFVMRNKMKERSEFVVHVTRNFKDSFREKESFDDTDSLNMPKSKPDVGLDFKTNEDNTYSHTCVTMTSSFTTYSAQKETRKEQSTEDPAGFEKTQAVSLPLSSPQENIQDTSLVRNRCEYPGTNGSASAVREAPIVLLCTADMGKAPQRSPPAAPVKPKAFSGPATGKPALLKSKPPLPASKPVGYGGRPDVKPKPKITPRKNV